ncbi:MAG TPA: fibrillarin-like rRNA/tRNA 2'-O-methyltransferase [Nitrososphaerales archaeon]|nr:fibrillarin-like rRNA/tRNA 2'-O-methyltransferase [Nitrososphaerales archaeon]HUK74222.1 fibrillarin-like rRNA/tRNA 2'-O-methyltransferase [Nitrososphaerales archaeon]
MSRLRLEERGGRRVLLTKNLVPGSRVYNEELMLKDGEEYRTWDPFRSKLAAAILKGLPADVICEGQKVLYLGTSTGTTASHVSDLVGESGLVVGVEFAPRVAREFVEAVARRRKNVIPYVADAREPGKYSLTTVDVVYCDIAQQDQTEIALLNCRRLLKKGGTLILIVKARSIDVVKEPSDVFGEEREKLVRAGLKVHKVLELSPYDKDHAIILATM